MGSWAADSARARVPACQPFPFCRTLSTPCSGDWNGALAFGLSVAVGLTPQMLPLVVTANLVRGAAQLRQRNCAVRRHEAIQDLGAMWVAAVSSMGMHECL